MKVRGVYDIISFGVHACHIDELKQIVKQTFVDTQGAIGTPSQENH